MTAERKPRAKQSSEIAAMATLERMLGALNPDAQHRVVEWLTAKYIHKAQGEV